MVGVGLGELRKGENELSMKKRILLALHITIELVVVLGISPETSCDSAIGCHPGLEPPPPGPNTVHDVSGLIPKIIAKSIVI